MPKVKSVPKSRAWSFTDFERTAVATEIKADKRVRYVQWGEEVCPETKREHRQGMIVFFKQERRSVVQELVGNKCHCEPARNEWALEKYNAKEGKVVSAGEMVKQGSREDIKKAVNAAIEADGDIEKLIDAAPVEFVKYSRGLKEVMRVKEKKPAWRVVHTEIHWGKSGYGKSHYAPCVYGDANVYRWNKASYPWLEGYNGQDVLLIDEFAPEWIPFTELLNLLDGHPLQMQVKGSFVTAKWTKVSQTRAGDLI